MKLKRLNILCEGPTEENFVRKVLSDYFKPLGIITKVRQVTTNKKQNIHGGMTTYVRVKNDFCLWIKENRKDVDVVDYYTSMFDYYGLPDDFPKCPHQVVNVINKVECLERCFAKDLDIPNFIPNIMLHEFEALVFTGLDYLIEDYPGKEKAIETLKKQLIKCKGAPEDVNNDRSTAPSKRLEKALGKYNKIKSGVTVTSRVGIDNIKKSCPHFNNWIEKIINI